MSRKRVKKEATYVCSSGSDSDFVDEPKQATRAKRRRTTKDVDEYKPAGDSMSLGGHAVKHSASIHRIANPKPLQSALLDWYAGVHEKRGMPWRKPFVSTSDKKIRSQRAYEVR